MAVRLNQSRDFEVARQVVPSNEQITRGCVRLPLGWGVVGRSCRFGIDPKELVGA